MIHPEIDAAIAALERARAMGGTNAIQTEIRSAIAGLKQLAMELRGGEPTPEIMKWAEEVHAQAAGESVGSPDMPVFGRMHDRKCINPAVIECRQSECQRLGHCKLMPSEAGTAAPPADTPAIGDVITERRRQIEAEGWSLEHDDEHDGTMAAAGACYAILGSVSEPTEHFTQTTFSRYWPWDRKWWKPKDRRRNLVRAAALIVAEIERLDRIPVTAPDASADRRPKASVSRGEKSNDRGGERPPPLDEPNKEIIDRLRSFAWNFGGYWGGEFCRLFKDEEDDALKRQIIAGLCTSAEQSQEGGVQKIVYGGGRAAGKTERMRAEQPQEGGNASETMDAAQIIPDRYYVGSHDLRGDTPLTASGPDAVARAIADETPIDELVQTATGGEARAALTSAIAAAITQAREDGAHEALKRYSAIDTLLPSPDAVARAQQALTLARFDDEQSAVEVIAAAITRAVEAREEEIVDYIRTRDWWLDRDLREKLVLGIRARGNADAASRPDERAPT